jgi:hypothetical protein
MPSLLAAAPMAVPALRTHVRNIIAYNAYNSGENIDVDDSYMARQ